MTRMMINLKAEPLQKDPQGNKRKLESIERYAAGLKTSAEIRLQKFLWGDMISGHYNILECSLRLSFWSNCGFHLVEMDG